MFYLLLISITLLLFLAFMALTLIEARTGTRFLGAQRGGLDEFVLRAEFVLDHVEWGEFTAHLVRSFFERIAHDIVHLTLIAVRAAERALTRFMRSLRERHPNVLAPEPSRPPVASQIRTYLRRAVRSSANDQRAQRTAEAVPGSAATTPEDHER